MDFSLPVLLAIFVGGLLKKSQDVSNKLIPVLVFVSQFLGRLLVEIGVGTAHAGVLGAAVAAVGPHVGSMLLNSLLATIGAVGVHSTWKNSAQGFVKFLGQFAAKEVAGVVEKSQ